MTAIDSACRVLWRSGGPGEGLDPGADVETMLGGVTRSRRCCTLEPQDARKLVGRGHGFAIEARALRSDWRRLLGDDLPEGTPGIVLVRFAQGAWDDHIDRMAEAYGLTRKEAALAAALAEFGDFEGCHDEAGLDFVAARNALTRLRSKLGTRNLPQTVDHLNFFFLSSAPDYEVPRDAVIADLLDLNLRELAVARRLVAGWSRQQIASEDGVSLATIKAVLSSVYEKLDVSSAAELAALLAQALRVAEAFIADRAADGASGAEERVRELTREGRRVVWSSFGDPDAPVLVISHSNACARCPPSRLVRRLCLRGWRVIAPDRPGFGDTDPASAPGMDSLLDTAIGDMRAILAAERADRVVFLSRSNGQMGIALPDALGPLVGRAIMVNPTPPVHATPVDRGPLGAIKRRFARDPRSIRLMITLLLRLANTQRLRAAMRRSFAHSPPDLAATDDPVMVEDYLKASLPLRRGLEGYVTEVEGWSRGWDPRPRDREREYEIVFGRHFVLHDPAHARRHFERVLPHVRITTIENAGHMLMYSHADQLADYIGRAPA